MKLHLFRQSCQTRPDQPSVRTVTVEQWVSKTGAASWTNPRHQGRAANVGTNRRISQQETPGRETKKDDPPGAIAGEFEAEAR